MQHHLVAAILLLTLIMLLNLESWTSRLIYLAAVLLSFGYFGALQAAITIIAMTFIFVFYVAVSKVQKNTGLPH